MEKYWEESISFKIQQKKKEWLSFMEEVSKNEITYCLEIGCYDGGTTVFLSNFCKNLITIDQPTPARFEQFKYTHGDSSMKGIQYIENKCNFNYVGGNSHGDDTLQKVKELLGENKLDLLFIDGDHSYNGVKSDFNMYSNLVKSNGMIAFHDIHNSKFHEQHGCFVHRFWEELISDNREHKTFYDNEQNAVWGGIGLIYKA
jgi:predicted O-methyltransferase YrrM